MAWGFGFVYGRGTGFEGIGGGVVVWGFGFVHGRGTGFEAIGYGVVAGKSV